MARQVLPAIGAAVGFWIGGPQGALWGWQIGSVVGSVVDPQRIPGPQLGEIAQQTSQEGGPRPIIFALSPPIAGNIIVSGPPRIVRRTQRQGKGGPKVETESVYRTYAIGVCEGPITGFWRIWRNGTLVYDASDDPLIDAEENAAFLETARLFLGTFTQDASPDIEALVDPTPAHRGTAYLVMADEDLTDLRGAIPQYQFQVLRCEGEFFTSEIYPLEERDAFDTAGAAVVAELAAPPGPTIITTTMAAEALDTTGEGLDGMLRDPLRVYELAEALDTGGELADAELRVAIVVTEYDPEALDNGGEIAEAELRRALITYDDADPEGFDTTGEAVEGSLDEP